MDIKITCHLSDGHMLRAIHYDVEQPFDEFAKAVSDAAEAARQGGFNYVLASNVPNQTTHILPPALLENARFVVSVYEEISFE